MVIGKTSNIERLEWKERYGRDAPTSSRLGESSRHAAVVRAPGSHYARGGVCGDSRKHGSGMDPPVRLAQIRNPKPEIRNKLEIRNSKFLRYSIFDSWHCSQ